MKIDDFLSRLNKVKRTGEGQYLACCPAHDDSSPSLSVAESPEGLVLVHCFASCAVEDVVGAVGMTLSDLMPDRVDVQPNRRMRVSARDVLEAIAFQAKVVALCACDVGSGKTLTVEEKNKLLAVSAEIDEAIEYATR